MLHVTGISVIGAAFSGDDPDSPDVDCNSARLRGLKGLICGSVGLNSFTWKIQIFVKEVLIINKLKKLTRSKTLGERVNGLLESTSSYFTDAAVLAGGGASKKLYKSPAKKN